MEHPALPLTEQFGLLLKRFRRARNLTREELGKRVGCSTITVEKVEIGERRPSRQIAELLVRELSIPLEQHAAFVKFARGELSVAEVEALQAQLDPHAATPPKQPTPNNLAAQISTFIGRIEEMDMVLGLLNDQQLRLLTLTGPGGVGKTRLACQIACEMLGNGSFPDGIYFVSLASLLDPDLVVNAIAGVLGVKDSPNQPLIDSVRKRLRKGHTLLVLDNFEHILSAAPLVAELLAACPYLKVLVTSREALRLVGEQECPVPPMDLPPVDRAAFEDGKLREALVHNEAVSLFVARASAVLPQFRLGEENALAVAKVVRRLDGLPLAIELAAARSKMLTPQAMLEGVGRLNLLVRGPQDQPARHQTMRAAIDWSYNLLDAVEKALFRRLSIFVGGCNAQAVDAVCNADGELPVDMVDGLESLVTKSLLKVEECIGGEARFSMLETVREYAFGELAASRELPFIESQHADFFMNLVEKAEPELIGEHQARWHARLTEEQENIRAALSWSVKRGDRHSVITGLRTVGALRQFWWVQSRPAEAVHWCKAVFEAKDDLGDNSIPTPVLAKALNTAGALSSRIAEFYQQALSYHEQALALRRDMGEETSVAQSLTNLGIVKHQQGCYSEAAQYYEEALLLHRKLGNNGYIAGTLCNLALSLQYSGDLDKAQACLEEGLQLSRAIKDSYTALATLLNLAYGALMARDYEKARTIFTEVLPMAQQLGDKYMEQAGARALGYLATLSGDYTTACSLHSQALHALAEIGYTWTVPWNLTAIALLLARMQRPRQAAQSLGAAQRVYDVTKSRQELNSITDVDGLSVEIRDMLGSEAFEAAWAEGHAMDAADATTLALNCLRDIVATPE